MRVRIGFALGVVAMLVFAVAAIAAPAQYKVTGGGQTLIGSESNSQQGPGDTVTFQAFIANQGTDENATGHVNVIDRTPGAGGKGIHYRGEVSCTFLASDPVTGGGYAELFGTATDKDGEEVDFVVRIQDNGQGADNTDMVEFDTSSPEECDEDNEENDPAFHLARGNAKIHKQSPSQSGARSSKSSTSTSQSTSLLSALR